jgi:tetratricopeptide (TPR) repeat protein
MVLSLSISVHTVCYHVFTELQQTELRQAALAEGLKDAKALERFQSSAKAVSERWVFLDEIGQAATALADLRKACFATKNGTLVFYCGTFLYRQGHFAEAASVLELGKGETVIDFARLFALLELPDGAVRAKELFKEIEARDLDSWDLFNRQLILRFLGDKTKAVDASREFQKQPARFPPIKQEQFQLALKYCADQLSADELIVALSGKRIDLSTAHLCIALTALADGDRDAARRHLKLCEETRYYDALPYTLSQMMLSRMKNDDTWPPWIETKKKRNPPKGGKP